MSQEMAPTLIVDIGASTTKMAIVDRGVMRLSYSVAKGSQDISSSLSKSLNISFSRAEEMKRTIGISEAPEHKEMLSVISPTLEYIFSEANSVIINYQAKNKRVINKVVLTGGGSLMRGMVDFAVKRLNIEVSLSDPFERGAYPAFLQGVLKEAGPSFAVAIGLALRKLQF
jgi:type IV pilus assembly protein PilM